MDDSAIIQSFKSNLLNATKIKEEILVNEAIVSTLVRVVNLSIECFKGGNKILFCGNGGSAADAQHLSAEFTGRFYFDRAPLFSEALHTNTSYMTAVANDYSYDEVYARLLRGIGKKGDLIFGLSTSGNSKNIVRAFEVAKELGITSVAMTGQLGGLLKNVADQIFKIPSTDTPRIQEAHMFLGHTICELVEHSLFKSKR